jgi:hypothetical protein
LEVIPLRTQGRRPLDESRSEWDATFSVLEEEGGFAIVWESRSGTKGTPQARNTQYQQALEAVLRRLADARLTVNEVCLDPGGVRNEGRQSVLCVPGHPYPWVMAAIEELRELRVALCKAQATTDREPEAKGPGNPTKRILISVAVDAAIDANEVAGTASLQQFSERGVRRISHAADARPESTP